MMMNEWIPIILSLKLAVVTTMLLMAGCFPFACLLAFRKYRFKPVIEAITTLPVVIPPTVLGFYLLMFFSPNGYLGRILEEFFHVRLVFSFGGMVLASCIYSLPFMFQPLVTGLENIDKSLIEASYTSGKSRLATFARIILPNMKSFIILGTVITFAHTMGGFGVFLMVGGSIPGETNITSIAIYEKVMELDFTGANYYSLFLLAVSFAVLVTVFFLNRKKPKGVII